MIQSCETCLFARPAPYRPTVSDKPNIPVTCHKYPPLAQTHPRFALWPLVRHQDWCGEYQPK